MKKNGFIATSLLYAFFLVFISLFIVLLLNFLHNRLLVQKIEDEARERLNKLNNMTFEDLKIGDYVQISRASNNFESNILSGEGMWQVYDMEYDNVNGYMTVKFLSDLTVSAPSVKVKLESDSITKRHPMTVQVFEEIKKYNDMTYGIGRDALIYNMINIDNYNGYYKTADVHISLVDAQTLQSIRNNPNIDASVKRSLFNVKGSYIVAMNENTDFSSAGYITNYTYPTGLVGSYYVYKAYNFDNYRNAGGNLTNANATTTKLLNDYCGASYNPNTGNITYSYTNNGSTKANPFGYVDVTDNRTLSDDKTTINTTKNIDFCYFASPVGYTHTTGDLIVIENETTGGSGDFIETTLTPIYKLRYKLEVMYGWSPYNSGKYTDAPIIKGGKGLPNDPYIIGSTVSSITTGIDVNGCRGSGCYHMAK